MTAWFQVNSNVKENDPNKELKRRIVEIYIDANNVTDKNRKNVKNMVNSIKDEDFRKDLNDKIQK